MAVPGDRLLVGAPARALAIYAHPDDPEVSCGGTLARWADAGSEVHVVVCCRGDKGTSDPAADPDELARRRAGELAAAAEALGATAHHALGRPDGDLEDDRALRSELVALVRSIRPETVIAPDPTAVFFGGRYVNHRDHRVVGWSVVDAVAPAAANPHYFPEAGEPHQVSTLLLSGTLEPDAWVDITDVVDRKAAAIACHASQVGEPGEWLRDLVRERAEEGGRAAGVAYAEGYRRITLA